MVKGIRWSLFLRALGIHGTGQALRVTFVGHALNNVLIANGGDAVRVAAMARQQPGPSAKVLATLAIDRLCDLVSYAALFVVAAFALPLPPELARWRTPRHSRPRRNGVAVTALVWRSAKHRTARATPEATPRRCCSSAPAITGADSPRRRRSSRRLRRLAVAVALAFVAWAGQWATFHYAAHAASFPTTPADSLLALLVVNCELLVRLTPGNVGVFQLLYALAATSTGLDKDSAVAVAFLISLIQYIPVTIIGLLLARSLTAEEHAPGVTQLAQPSPADSDQNLLNPWRATSTSLTRCAPPAHDRAYSSCADFRSGRGEAARSVRRGAERNRRDVPAGIGWSMRRRNFDAIVPTVVDDVPAAVFATQPLRLRIVANYGVGLRPHRSRGGSRRTTSS